jgi:hypothetical protein
MYRSTPFFPLSFPGVERSRKENGYVCLTSLANGTRIFNFGMI